MVEMVLNGRTRNKATVTLDAGTTTTTVDDPLFESHQIVILQPMSAAAAFEIPGGELYISSRSDGSFTITHSISAESDRLFGYVFVG